MRARELISIATCAVLFGCGSGEADRAKQVAQAFWDATVAGDAELAQTFVSAGSMFQPNKSKGDSPPGDVKLGAVDVDGDDAAVETVVTKLDAESPMNMEFETILVREEGSWKIDMDKTTGSMMQGAFAAMAEAMGSAMQGMAEGMAEGMKEGMKEGFAQMDKSPGTEKR